MRKFTICLALILATASEAKPQNANRCAYWFNTAGKIMTDRQDELPLDAALDTLPSYPLADRYLVRRLIERAYELPLRYTDNGKQEIVEGFAGAARSACSNG